MGPSHDADAILPPPASALVDGDTPARHHERRLRNTLRLNGATSFAGGVVTAVAAGPLARWLGTGHAWWVGLLGAGLIVFAGGVMALAGTSTQRLRRWTPMVIGADVAWAGASVATSLAGWFSTPGVIVVLVVALQVAVFAVGQTIGWYHTGTARR